MLKNIHLFNDLSQTLAAPLFEQTTYPWEVLPKIKDFVRALGPTLDPEAYDLVAEEVWVHKSCKVFPTATLIGPTIICEGTEVRPGAFIRGSVLVGKGCVIGNSTELKNCILFDKAQAPHYNYIGDSIFGAYSHTGAGAICSNLKSDKSLITVHCIDGTAYETGLKKFGAILGDHVEVGCNSVLCPGTVICPFSNIYPLTRVRGAVPPNCIVKSMDAIVEKQ